MGVLPRCDSISKSALSKSKIPDYAREYRNEYLFIKGINKKCKDFVNLIKENEEFYNGPEALRIFKFNKIQKIGNLKYICFNILDVKNIYIIRVELDKYIDLYCDPYTDEFDEERYNNNVESDNPGFKSFYNCFYKFYDKIDIDEDYSIECGVEEKYRRKNMSKGMKKLKESKDKNKIKIKLAKKLARCYFIFVNMGHMS